MPKPNLIGKVQSEGPDNKPGIEVAGTDEKKSFVVRSYEPVTTAEEAFEKAGLDSSIWEVTKVTANSWEVFAEGEHRNLWQVKIECRRLVAKAIEKATELIAERIHKKAVTIHRPRKKKIKHAHTIVSGLVDHHFGKLCWEPETGSEYDLKIARQLWQRAAEVMIERAATYDVEEIVVPIGNDMCHFDNRQGTTEHGTPQDSDSRYAKVCDAMEESLLSTLELYGRTYRNVRVIWVGGNHDYITSYWLCRMARQAFRNVKHFTFDLSPSSHKYYQFGKCLIGFSHGNAPKKASLMAMMPVDVPNLWAKSTACREWHTGHFHQKETTTRIGTSEQAGMQFRVLPSLCGADAWHASHGYTMCRRATESYLYSHQYGMRGYFAEPAEALS
jgi:hypothetical protein